MAVGARRRSGNPLRTTVGTNRTTIDRAGQLGPDPGTATLDPAEETAIQFARRALHQSDRTLDAGGAKPLQPTAIDFRMRVSGGDHYPGNTCLDQRFGAWRRTAVVAAGFECDVGRRAARPRPGLDQRTNLGMRAASTLVPAAPEHLGSVRDHTAHPRVWRRSPKPPARKPQGLGHQGVVGGGERRFWRSGQEYALPDSVFNGVRAGFDGRIKPSQSIVARGSAAHPGNPCIAFHPQQIVNCHAGRAARSGGCRWHRA